MASHTVTLSPRISFAKSGTLGQGFSSSAVSLSIAPLTPSFPSSKQTITHSFYIYIYICYMYVNEIQLA